MTREQFDPATYDQSKFYTRGVNADGASKVVSIRLDPDLKEVLEHVVAAYPSKYRTISDVLRDACAHRLMWLKNQEEVVDG